MRKVRWFVLNTGFPVLLLVASHYGIDFLQNIILFLVWVVSIISLMFLSPSYVRELVRKAGGFTVSKSADVAIDMLTLFALVGLGHFVTGAAWLIHTLNIYHGRTKFEEEEQSKEDENQTTLNV